MLDRHFFRHEALFVLLKSNLRINVKLYSEERRVNGKTTQNEPHCCHTASLSQETEANQNDQSLMSLSVSLHPASNYLTSVV